MRKVQNLHLVEQVKTVGDKTKGVVGIAQELQHLDTGIDTGV